jgi:hypothetical protein
MKLPIGRRHCGSIAAVATVEYGHATLKNLLIERLSGRDREFDRSRSAMAFVFAEKSWE